MKTNRQLIDENLILQLHIMRKLNRKGLLKLNKLLKNIK